MSFEMLRRLLFLLPPEIAHRLALELLRIARVARWPLPGEPIRSGAGTECMGLRFANPVGLAAGFDKSGDFIDDLGALGFGFLEIGTLTPRAQPGNARPRIFRVPAETALVNRMGSPNRGIDHAIARIRNRAYSGVLGANIGKGVGTPLQDAVRDYVDGYRRIHEHVDYVALNVSSPNTPRLRDLQDQAYLGTLLRAVVEHREGSTKSTPVLVKLSPDFEPETLKAVAHTIAASGVDGVIATNSTVERTGAAVLDSRLIHGGGVSGRPLHAKSLSVIRALREQLGPRAVIIGVGGIVSPAAAAETLDAGADLIQLYTGLVYQGPRLVADIVRSTEAAMS